MTNRIETLEALRADLQERLEKYHRHQHPEPGSVEKDWTERAVQRQNDDVVNRLEAEATEELRQVNHALDLLEEGLGDECERCGQPIHPERLAALPYTTLCVRCAE